MAPFEYKCFDLSNLQLNQEGIMRFLMGVLGLLWVGCQGPQKKEVSSTVQEKGVIESLPPIQKKIILFFGNSITAGYQLDMNQAFPAIIQHKIDSLGLSYQVINAGLSGETTASGKNRIDWVLRTVPDIFILELGANDGLRGLPLRETPKNLQVIIDKVKSINPEVKIIITGMEVPPNLGESYTRQFRNIFSTLAKNNAAALIPFLLIDVAGKPTLNLADGIHPTPEGHLLIAELVWKTLLPLLELN